ncbi:uncharacterized protein LOC130701782 [Daphnia carinata]|uniref:uncharacterized protein LOC130701782 n=1 Tax=Daphnia carinata TaxID=120202 RepID=UPI00286935B0|nr:uncharacterized protein LOC130701782 [Daphnia carinata]
MAVPVRNKFFTCFFSFHKKVNSQQTFGLFSSSKCFRPANSTSIHTTSLKSSNLMQFFDDTKNFGASEVKSGRSWTLDELRIKSNVDLHKLWYVLLKERNMLLTMEYNCREACHLFPSPERIDKIQDSMTRLEQVIHERNDAYWQLEIGEEAPKPRGENTLDPTDPLAVVRGPIEAVTQVKDRATLKFQYLIKEKERKLRLKQKRLHEREAAMLLKYFPNMDKEALQAKYPDVNVERLRFVKTTRGSHEFNTASAQAEENPHDNPTRIGVYKVMGAKPTTLLSLEDIDECCELTYFSRRDIIRLFDRFYRINPNAVKANPFGVRLPAADIFASIEELKCNPFRQRLAYVFSSKQDDCFSFDDFVDLASAFCEKAPPSVRASFAFRIYDFDNDGLLTASDLGRLIDFLTCDSENSTKLPERDEVVGYILEEAGVEGNRSINEAEFQLVVKKLPDFATSFKLIM